MDNPGLPNTLWSVLSGGLWHATGKKQLNSIFETQCISIVAGRYNNSFCKSLGSVSLFDFGPSATDKSGQFKNWYGWFGKEQGSRVVVWLRIDRQLAERNLLDAEEARLRWRKAPTTMIIPGVEACHRGNVSLTSIVDCLLIDGVDLENFKVIEVSGETVAEIEKFESCLVPDPRPGSIASRLSAARLNFKNRTTNK